MMDFWKRNFNVFMDEIFSTRRKIFLYLKQVLLLNRRDE